MNLALSIICDELAHMRPDLLSDPIMRYKRPRASRTAKLTPERSTIRGVRLLDSTVDADVLDSGFIYIAKKDQLGTDDRPRANILCIGTSPFKSAAEGGFRIVEIAADADSLDVLETVLSIFERYNAWYSDFTHAIMGRAPLEKLLEVGCSLFRNPVSLASPSLENLALAGAKLPRDIHGSIWETILDKGYSPLEAIGRDELELLIAEIERGNPPRLSRPQRAYSDNCFLIVPVNDGSRFPPSLASSDICEPFTDGQVDLIALIAKGIEAYLELTGAAGHVFSELALVAEMIFKESAVDKRRMEHALRRHQWFADDDYVLACVLGSETVLVDAIGTRVTSIVSDALVVHLEDQLAIIINCTRENGEASLDALDAVLKDMGLRGGVSHVTSDFINIDRALEQARIAARAALAQSTPGLLRFGENYIRCIIHMLEQQANRSSLVHPAVLALSELDKGETLIDTLACFLRHDGNASRTAQNLFLHRSTLAYRLNRIESATGLALKELSEDEATALLFSCLIIRE